MSEPSKPAHTWTTVFRLDDSEDWHDWSTGHRTVPEVLAVAELMAKIPTIAEIRFDRITTVRERFSLADLGTDGDVPPAASSSAPVDQVALRADLEEALKGAGIYDDEERMWRSLSPAWIQEIATEVLDVLPASVDRAAILREGADIIDGIRATMAAPPSDDRYEVGLIGAAGELRRVADAARAADMDEMAASLARDGFGDDEIAGLLSRPIEQPTADRAARWEAAANAAGREVDRNALAVYMAVADAEQAELRRERDLAVAHDRQPYPTAWAYEQACKALHRKEAAIDRVLEFAVRLGETGRQLAGPDAVHPVAAHIRHLLDTPADDEQQPEAAEGAQQ